MEYSTVKSNLLKAMWRAEALRKQLGNQPLRVTSGFRSKACDRQVVGSGNGQHTYGRAIDIGTGTNTSYNCRIAKQARYHGFNAIFGHGYPAHSDHVHVDIRNYRKWSASRCGI